MICAINNIGVRNSFGVAGVVDAIRIFVFRGFF